MLFRDAEVNIKQSPTGVKSGCPWGTGAGSSRLLVYLQSFLEWFVSLNNMQVELLSNFLKTVGIHCTFLPIATIQATITIQFTSPDLMSAWSPPGGMELRREFRAEGGCFIDKNLPPKKASNLPRAPQLRAASKLKIRAPPPGPSNLSWIPSKL